MRRLSGSPLHAGDGAAVAGCEPSVDWVLSEFGAISARGRTLSLVLLDACWSGSTESEAATRATRADSLGCRVAVISACGPRERAADGAFRRAVQEVFEEGALKAPQSAAELINNRMIAIRREKVDPNLPYGEGPEKFQHATLSLGKEITFPFVELDKQTCLLVVDPPESARGKEIYLSILRPDRTPEIVGTRLEAGDLFYRVLAHDRLGSAVLQVDGRSKPVAIHRLNELAYVDLEEATQSSSLFPTHKRTSTKLAALFEAYAGADVTHDSPEFRERVSRAHYAAARQLIQEGPTAWTKATLSGHLVRAFLAAPDLSPIKSSAWWLMQPDEQVLAWIEQGVSIDRLGPGATTAPAVAEELLFLGRGLLAGTLLYEAVQSQRVRSPTTERRYLWLAQDALRALPLEGASARVHAKRTDILDAWNSVSKGQSAWNRSVTKNKILESGPAPM